MASPVYVWHGSAQDDSDATWNSSTLSYLTLKLALAAVDANGIVYVASVHTETQASVMDLTGPGGVSVISVDKTDNSYQTMRAAGTTKIETTGNYHIQVFSSESFFGLTLVSGDDLRSSNNGVSTYFEDCEFFLSDNLMSFAGASCTCIDCLIKQVSYGYITTNDSYMYLENCTYTFETGGTTVYVMYLIGQGEMVAKNCDFSVLEWNDYLVNFQTGGGKSCLISGCTIPSGAWGGLVDTGPDSQGSVARFHGCSTVDGIYVFQENHYAGQVNEDTAIYLDATYDGTNGYSVKLLSNAVAKEYTTPLRFKLADLYVSAAGKILTVEIMTDNVTLQNDEFWLEVDYPDSTTAANRHMLYTRLANILDTPSDLITSSKGASDWTGEGTLTTPVYQKVAADFTGVADEAPGVYTVYACLAKPSTTVYVCPKVVVT